MPKLSNVASSLQPVKSFIVGLGADVATGGTTTAFRNLATEAYGDTKPPGALFASDVGNLTQRLRTAILSAITGNLTFTSPKVDFSSTPNGYICQPSFEYEKSDQWTFLHHPFTSPQEEDLELLESDPGAVTSRAYDLVINGYEIAGGSIRNHDPEVQMKILKLLGMSEEEASKRIRYQMDRAERLERSDVVIDNSSDMAGLKNAIKELWDRRIAV